MSFVKKKAIVFIPAYNEEKSIREVIERIPRSFVDEVEVVVVDDGSEDTTIQVAEGAGALVVHHKKNFGLVQAIKTGIKIGLRHGADFFVMIDADGQYLPEDIPKLVDPLLEEEADMVLGSRFAGEIEEMTTSKKIGNRLFTWYMRRLTGYPFTDTQTGFRAFTKEVAKELILQGSYTYTQEMLIHVVEKRFTIKEIPIFFAKRKHGKSRLIVNIGDYALKAFLITLRTYRDYHPLAFFGSIGILLTGAGAILGSYLVARWIFHGVVGRIPATILTALLILLGIFVFFIGFIADMIKTMREEIKETIKRLEIR